METTGKKTLRMGELEESPVRSERFFQQENYWYVRTREGLNIGPCDSKDCAIASMNAFIGFLKEANEETVISITKYVKNQARKQELLSYIPPRTDRIFQQEDYWYFKTREGIDIGPFDSTIEATLGAKGFVSFLEESQPETVEKVTHYIRSA